MRMSNLIDQIGIDLNDFASGHEFTTWSREQIAYYVREGLQIAFYFRPEFFTANKVFKLTGGTSFQKVCNCSDIKRVIGVCDENGNVKYQVKSRKHDLNNEWYGRACQQDPRKYRMNEYTIDGGQNAVWVYPAPPGGSSIFMLIECADLPTEVDETYAVNDEAAAAVVQWALFRAKMVDGENNSLIVNVANEHKKTCFNLLRVQVTGKLLAQIDDVAKSLPDASPQTNAINVLSTAVTATSGINGG